jgi:hypothetical protein
MVQGIDKALDWFKRTDKKGFRILSGSTPIAEYFDKEASVDVAYDRLKTELENLMGGEYYINVKDSKDSTDTKKGLTMRVILPAQGNMPMQAIAGTQQPVNNAALVPKGYYSSEEMEFRLKAIAREYQDKARMDKLEQTLEDMRNAPEKEDDSIISGIVKQVPWDQLIGVLLTKMIPAGNTVGITGPMDKKHRHVPPVQHQAPAAAATATPQAGADTNTDTLDPEDMTEEQADKLDDAFYAMSDLMGGDIETALQLIEALPVYIACNPQIFKAMLLPELTKYIGKHAAPEAWQQAITILNT